jgi:hypothetical protein
MIMKLQHIIEKPNEMQASTAVSLLRTVGVKKMIGEILSSRCLLAVDQDGKIIALAETIGQDKANVYYFKKFGIREKKRIRNSFFSVIFSELTWASEIHVETGAVKRQAAYMFPG